MCIIWAAGEVEVGSPMYNRLMQNGTAVVIVDD